MRPSVALTVLVMMLLLVSPFLPKIATAQPAQVNWIVDGTQVVKNESVTLNGNLTIENGGNLTLWDTGLRLNVQKDGQYGIMVEPGGSLYVYASNITASNGEYRFTFVVDGSHFVMKDSTVNGAGYGANCGKCYSAQSGLLVESNGSKIENSVISHGGVGLILTGNRDTVENTLIQQDDVYALDLRGANYADIVNNTFYQAPVNGYRPLVVQLENARHNSIVGNTVEETDPQSWYTVGAMDGIGLIDASAGNLVSRNNVAVANIGIFPFGGSDNAILCNKVLSGEMGISVIPTAGNTTLIGNNLTSSCSEGFGIIFDYGRDSVIADNEIYGNIQTSLLLDHSNNVSVIDNIIAASVAMNKIACFGGLPGSPQFGFASFHSSDNRYLGNVLSGTEYGLFLSDASNGNVVNDNSINANHTMIVADSNSNSIYGNQFIDVQGSSGGPYDNGINMWESGQMGNYWQYFGLTEYTRVLIAPNGVEQYSLLNPPEILSQEIPLAGSVSPPIPPDAPYSTSTFENESVSIPSGCLVGNITIEDSIVSLGAEGQVNLGGCGSTGGSMIIVNSKLLDAGWGFVIAAYSNYNQLLIENSTINGARMQDMGGPNMNILLTNDTFVNLQGPVGILIDGGALTVTITNSTMTDVLGGINIGGGQVSQRILLSGNVFRGVGAGIYVGSTGTPSVVVTNNVLNSSWSNGIYVAAAGATVAGNNIFLVFPSLKMGKTTQNVTSSTSTLTSVASSNISSTRSGSGGVPEFPFQLLAATVASSLVVASYLLYRHRHYFHLRE